MSEDPIKAASAVALEPAEAIGDEALDELLGGVAFDEAGYLRLNPDVARAVARGDVVSGYQHYISQGYREGRKLPIAEREAANSLLVSGVVAQPEIDAADIAFNFDAVLVTQTGAILAIGWVDDTTSSLVSIGLSTPGWRVVLDRSRFIRDRREDVERALGRQAVHSYGIVAFVHTDQRIKASGNVTVQVKLQNGVELQGQAPLRAVADIDLRDILLSRLADAKFYGNPAVERIARLDVGFGDQILAFNRAITGRLVANPYVEHFGRRSGRPRGSIIVTLYGKPEYLWTQNALYADLPGIDDYEFIYVSNSPELGEILMREARIGSLIYGISQTVMVLPGNAGFGAANNAALNAVRSNRILAVNPDVFPRQRDWAARHTAIVDAGGAAARLFGAPLYYDDGSLMHGGMHFELDELISLVEDRLTRRRMIRVEHYGKGAPPEGTTFLHERPVPAVSGAFISSDRGWFEKLGGFTEDFVFGHYEDADLCLKSFEKGTPSWLRDVRLWHFEGKGSTRFPQHEGGAAVNRWLFSRRWDKFITKGLLGPSPKHPLLGKGS